jgi:23S rRNA U2552 (ribose-2'-O)-methylase RlmE/FtsJ
MEFNTIDNSNFEVKVTEGENIQLPTLGYHSKLNNAKEQIDLIDPKVWSFYKMLLNPFEMVRPSTKYSTKKIIPVESPSRGYFKLWEILNRFPEILPISKSATFANLAEAPGGFLKALIDYRANMQPSDTFYVLTLKSGFQFFDDFLKKHKNLKVSYGDLTNSKDIDSYVSLFQKNKADIITADGGINTSSENFDQEKELFKLILGEVVAALQIQKPGGSFILKIFDGYRQTTLDIIYLLTVFYESVKIYKPQTSRPANSEKYIIATGFKDIKMTLTSQLYKVLNSPNEIKSFIQFKPPTGFIERYQVYNYRHLENQYKKIHEILSIIELYDYKIISNIEPYLERQIIIAKEWAMRNNIEV